MAKEFKITDSKGTVEEKGTEEKTPIIQEERESEKKVKNSKKNERKAKKEKKKREKEIKKSKEKDSVEEKKEIPQKDVKEKNPKEKKKLFKNFKWTKLLFPLAAILTLVGIGLFYYFGIYKLKPTPLFEVLSFDDMFVASFPDSRIFSSNLPLLSRPEEPRTEVSPLNGLLFSKSEMDEMMGRRPVAVMINNHVGARPLSGLNSADIVIEANAESGITRHLGIFWSKAPEQVGPIRSLRQSYLEWASEYDPLLIYDGCAQTDDPRTNACGNIHSYGMRIVGTIGAWRSNEGGRVAPHNEFSSIRNAWNYAERMDWDSFPQNIGTFEFKRDANIEERGNRTLVRTTFHTRLSNGGMYDVVWRYDSSTNTYLREIGGQPDMDGETNTQVNAKVVVIQEVRTVPSGDDAGRLITTTTGEGDAVILQDGKITNGSWKKDSRTDRTKYYDSSGNAIKFNRGRIWIAMIPHSDGKFDIIEQ
jgi:hypothetical protein